MPSKIQETHAEIIAEMRKKYSEYFDAADVRSVLRDFAARIEEAHKRELDAVALKPDPNWAEICEKCHDGEIEPKECEYYGEPNGCNSPIYGQHPKSKPCGNSAALREALKLCMKVMCEYCSKEAARREIFTPCLNGCETLRIAKAALDATEGGEREHQ